MNFTSAYKHSRPWRVVLLAAALTTLSLTSVAAPGAHGPDGEHLDGPRNTAAGSALPRVDAKSEAFELVAQLRGAELAVVIDRYETNEPVLGAKLEVESGSLKAVAAFRAEQGDYVVTEPALLRALSAPGEHPLVFTLVAGKDSDLLDGTLVIARKATAGAGNEHGHDHSNGHSHELERAAWIGAGIAGLGLLGGIAWWRQRRRNGAVNRGGL